MAVSARLFQAVVVAGAAITAPNCGRTERDDARDLDASTDAPGVSGAGGSAQSDANHLDQTAGSGGNPIDAAPEPVCITQLCVETGALEGCGDCVDNDKDGALDLDDPECASPCSSEAGCPPAPLCNPGQLPCDYVDGCLPTCPPTYYCLTGCCTSIP